MKAEIYGGLLFLLLLYWLFKNPSEAGVLLAQTADQSASLIATLEGR